jgi:hypothetical protein
MTSHGSAYARFQRALRTNNLQIIRAAAAELPRVDLPDALAVCAVIRRRRPQDFERAALRWLARFVAERPAVTLESLGEALDAFEEMREAADPSRSLTTLRGLCA